MSKILSSPQRTLFVLALGLLLSFTASLGAATDTKDDEFLIRNWDMEDGLPSSTAGWSSRDQKGYLWLATWRGLARFDGHRWVVFTSRTTPAMTNQRLHRVLAGRGGRLWLASIDGGLEQFAANSFNAVLPSSSIGKTLIHDLAEDDSGALWLATADGVFCLREGTATRYGATNGLPGNNITSVLCADSQHLWVVANGSLLSFQNGVWRTASIPTGMKVQSIAHRRSGGLWVAALDGDQTRILRWPESPAGTFSEIIPWPSHEHWTNFVALAEDRSGQLWCADHNGVMIRHANGAWHLLLPNSLQDNVEITSLCVDQDDYAWIGSRRNGLYLARPRLARILSLPGGVPPQTQILTVAIGDDDSIWAGTDGGGVCRWNHGTNCWLGAEVGLAGLTVNALLEDRRTNLWAGTDGGLCHWDGRRFQPVRDAAPLRENVRALLEDTNGDLWAGGDLGLARWSGGRAEVFVLPGLSPRTSIAALAGDSAGKIWAGTASGQLFMKPADAPAFEVVKFRPETVRLASIQGMHAALDGSLWILTAGHGLYCLRQGTMQNWDWVSGQLPSDYQYGIADDTKGNLWISCQRGIFGIANDTFTLPDIPDQLPVSWQLGTEDGLAQKVCTGRGQPAAVRSRDGRLWFPDGKTLAEFDPAVVTTSNSAAKPVIEQFLVDGQAQSIATGVPGIQSGARTITFQFSAPAPVGAERQRYKTRLDGVDDDWVDAENNRSISYNHLRPGHYAFHVAVAAPNGFGASYSSAMEFQIIPRLYERRSVQVAALVLVLVATAGGVWRWERVRSARRLARLKAQQEMERERTRIARDIHDELGSGLTEIILLSNSLKDGPPNGSEAPELVSRINERAQMLTQDMDEVVWAVDARNDTVEGLLNYLNDFAQRHLNLANIACHLDIPVDMPNQLISAEVRHNLFLAAKETINNITRHSGATAASIRARFEPPQFALIIEDNGHGFDLGNTRAHGSGLRNIQQRLEEIGGECVIESLPAGGTRIRFTVQVKPAH